MIIMIKKQIHLIAFLIFAMAAILEVNAQDVKIKPSMTGGDTANTDYLKGEARRLRENCQSLKTKAQELIITYEGYVEKTKECPGAKEEAKLALDMAKKAMKEGEAGIKLADKAEKATKMKDAKKSLSQIDIKIKSGHEYLKESDERRKEIEFEMKGC
jgi:hypothetical protein